MSIPSARQGEVWDCDLSPVTGHEQAGRKRPCAVVSVDQLGTGPSGLAIVVPITGTKRTALDVEIAPPEGGTDKISYAAPYQVRAVSRERMVERRGRLRDSTTEDVIRRVHLLTRPQSG